MNPFLNLISKRKPLLIVQMTPPTDVLRDSNNFKNKSAPILFQAESMFTRNDDVINVNLQGTEIFFKDIHAKRMDRVKIISINKNLIGIISVIF